MNEAAREILKTAFASQGERMYASGSVCLGLLKDFGGNDHPEIKLLAEAVDAKIPARLATHGSASPEMLQRLAQDLADRRFFDRGWSQWAVESWAMALGLQSENPVVLSNNPAGFNTAPQKSALKGAAENHWHFLATGQAAGPIPESALLSLLDSGALDPGILLWKQGLQEWKPAKACFSLQRPATASPAQPPAYTKSRSSVTAPKVSSAASSQALLLYIPEERLISMSLVTFGLYQVYWLYKNWKYLQVRDDLQIRPFWRAIFGVFYIRSLLKTIESDQEFNQVVKSRFSSDVLAAGWIILITLGSLSGMVQDTRVNFVGAVIAAPSFLCLLPVQKHINRVNEAFLARPPFQRWSIGDAVCLVLGAAIWRLLVVGLPT